MTTIILDKKTLRKNALNKRMSNPFVKFSSDIIVKKITSSLIFKNAKHIALYLPIKNEIDLTKLLENKDKNFYLPRCNDLELEFVKHQNKNDLVQNKWGILEPTGNKINPEILDVIYIPALVANENNYRLGYGKGFYDRFFSQNKIKAKKIIVISKEFILNDFVQDEFDVKCDAILTDW